MDFSAEGSLSSGIKERLLPIVEDEMGLKLKEFARLAGVNYTTLWAMLKRGSTPRSDTLQSIARAAGVNPEWLLTGRGPKRLPDEPAPGVNEGATEPLDEQLLASVIELVDRHLAELEKQGRLDPKRLPAAKRAKIVALVYADAIERHAKSPRKALVERIIALLA